MIDEIIFVLYSWIDARMIEGVWIIFFTYNIYNLYLNTNQPVTLQKRLGNRLPEQAEEATSVGIDFVELCVRNGMYSDPSGPLSEIQFGGKLISIHKRSCKGTALNPVEPNELQ